MIIVIYIISEFFIQLTSIPRNTKYEIKSNFGNLMQIVIIAYDTISFNNFNGLLYFIN